MMKLLSALRTLMFFVATLQTNRTTTHEVRQRAVCRGCGVRWVMKTSMANVNMSDP